MRTHAVTTLLGRGLLAVTTITMLGCFPTLPPDDETDADGKVENPAETSVPAPDVDVPVEVATPDVDPLDADETTAPLPDVPVADVSEVTGTDVGPEVSVLEDVDDAEVTEAPDVEVVEPPECATDSDCPDSAAPCSLWSCDEGNCVEDRADDGVECDDGDLCTDDDVCVAGLCKGTDRVCVPSSVCVEAAGCFSTTGACIEVPVSDSRACDDNDSCTTDDTCADGFCVGGPAPTATGDLALVMGAGSTQLTPYNVLGAPDGSLRVIARVPPSYATTSGVPLLTIPEGDVSIGFIDIPVGATSVTSARWATPLDSFSAGPYTARIGSTRTASGGLSMAGHFNGAFSPVGDARLIGEPISATDNSTEGLFIAQLDASLVTEWAASVHGTFEMSGFPAMNGLMETLGSDLWRGAQAGGGLAVIHMGTPKKFALVDANGNVATVDATTREIDTLTMLWWLSDAGIASELGRLTAPSGRFVVRDATLLDDGTRIIAGVAENATITLTTAAGDHVMPSSAHTARYAWTVAIAVNGDVLWSRAFRVPAGGAGEASDDVYVGVVGGDGSSVAVAVYATRNPVVTGAGIASTALRQGIAIGQPVTEYWTIAKFDTMTGALVESHPINGTDVWITTLMSDDDGLVVGGRANAISSGVEQLSNIGGMARPFAMRLGSWARWLAWRPQDDDAQSEPMDPGIIGKFQDLYPSMSLADDGGLTTWLAGADGQLQMGPDRSATVTEGAPMSVMGIARFNTNHSVDCAAD